VRQEIDGAPVRTGSNAADFWVASATAGVVGAVLTYSASPVSA
jgi:hypothetical protein